MGQRAGSFYQMKNKEKGRHKQKISDWLGPHSQPCLAYKCLKVAQSLGTGWIYCVCVQAEHLQGHEVCLSFGLLAFHLCRSGSILGLKIYFKSTKASFQQSSCKLWYLELLLSGMHKTWRACLQSAFGADLDWRLHIKQNLNSLMKIKPPHHTEKDRLKNLNLDLDSGQRKKQPLHSQSEAGLYLACSPMKIIQFKILRVINYFNILQMKR